MLLCCSFLDAHKPAERHNTYIWGYIADSCTLIMIGLSIVVILQPVYDDPDATRWFRSVKQVAAQLVRPASLFSSPLKPYPHSYFPLSTGLAMRITLVIVVSLAVYGTIYVAGKTIN